MVSPYAAGGTNDVTGRIVSERLQARLGARRAALALGAIWALWHLPLFFFPGTVHAQVGAGSAWFMLFLGQVVAMSVVMAWLFDRTHRSTLGAILFATSVVGIFLNRKNIIVLLMALELMLLAVNMNFVAFSHYLGDAAGQIFVFFILTVAAAESAIGLAIIVVLFRNLNTIDVEDLDRLEG